MKGKVRSIARAAVLGLTAFAAAACGGDGADRIWRFALEETRGSVQDTYASRFEELIEEKSGGEIDVIVYPYGTLGTSDQTTEQLYNGTLQFAMASPGHLGKLIPEVQVFLLHFLLSGDADIDNRALADPDLRATFDRLYREKNFVLLTFITEGDMVWTTKSPVRRPADFAGVKMRVMTTPLLLAAYRAYGASPTPLAYSEVYSALQLNMIDAQVNPVFAIEEMSFYEVTNYMIFPDHAQFVASVMTNADFYEQLEPGERKWVDDAIAELQPYILEKQKAFSESRLEEILEKKPRMEVVHLSEQERAAFREASLPVRDRFVRQVGSEGEKVLEQLLTAVRRSRVRAE